MKRTLIVILILQVIIGQNYGQVISQWRGQDRNGNYYEQDLLKKWPEKGPDNLWSIDGIGEGYSSASVTNNMIYISGMKDSLEYLSDN